MLTPADDAALRREMARGWDRWGHPPVGAVNRTARRIETTVARTAELLAKAVRENDRRTRREGT